MVFSSLEFIFYFLPAFLICYFLVPQKFRNLILCLGSIVFYALGTLDHPLYILLIIASILVNYLLALIMNHPASRKKRILILGLIYNFSWLFVFKYADFLFSGINAILIGIFPQGNVQIKPLGLVLPIGISFYTFQIVSYLIDVYRGKYRAERSLIDLGTYICMFPQLIAGPIVTYTEIKNQLKTRTCGKRDLIAGLQMFIFGLGLKVLLANRIAGLWTALSTIGYESITTPLAWMGLFAYTFQIYFDFFGYSLMAIGLGRMLGFRLPINFCHPYLSLSITEFWRRWHITLGRWFREYVYIPLGGSRKGKARMIFNLLIVWLFTGLWHGASLNFLLWGLGFFVVLSLEKFGLKTFLDHHPSLGHLYLLILIPLSWSLFAITDLSQLSLFLDRLFPFFSQTEATVVFHQDYLKYAKDYGLLLLICFFFITKLPYELFSKKHDSFWGTLFLLVVFWASVYCMYKGLNDPFLYFRF